MERSKKIVQISIVGIIVNLILVAFKAVISEYEKHWTYISGFVVFGETAEETAIREVYRFAK